MQQTVGAVTTDYTLDLNAGLTQVLSDGTDTYLYGLGRIGEFDGTDWTYPLADALGSVRQLTDSSGAPVMAQNYAPYGDVLESYGAESSNYGFAGEWTDGTGLQYLRARYLNTGIGRFITRDTWGGDYQRPMSLNRWGYVEGNPVNFTDPSGHCIFAVVDTLMCIGIGVLIGGVTGLIGGALYASTSYDWALAGECGCDMEEWAKGTNKAAFVRKTAAQSTVIGLVAGGIALAAPIGAIGVGLVGGGFAVNDIINLLKPKYQTNTLLSDWNKCEILRLAVDVLALVGSYAGIKAGVRGWNKSGSPWSWSAGTGNPLYPDNDIGKTVVNDKSKPYPQYTDPRTNKPIPFPTKDPNSIRVVPSSQRVSRISSTRNVFIKEWKALGFPEPNGGWGAYEIHHIKPIRFGGDNQFWNLVPVEKGFHVSEFNSFWTNWFIN